METPKITLCRTTVVNRDNIQKCCRLCLKTGLKMSEIFCKEPSCNSSNAVKRINPTTIFLTLNIKV